MRHLVGRFSVVVAVVAASLVASGVSVLESDARPALADAVDDEVAAFRELVRQGDQAQVLPRISSWKRKRDKRYDAALVTVLRAPEMDEAAREAMKVLGQHGDAAYVAWVRSKLTDERMLEEKTALFLAMLQSLPPAGVALKPALPALAKFVDDQVTKRPDAATLAIRAYGAAGSEKAVVEQMVSWLEKLEGGGGGGGGARGGLVTPPPTMNGGGGGGTSTQGPQDALLDELRKLTGGNGTNAGTWRLWWNANKAGFKPQPPRAAEPDWLLLKEFEDDVFGYVLKKPGGDADWTFERCEAEGGRARMRCTRKGETMALVDVVARKKGSHATGEALAHHLEQEWRKGDFAEFFPQGEPAVRTQTIGGRAFAVVAARGIGAGGWKDWDGFERRAYVTAGDDATWLCFSAACRSGLPDPKKAALWAGLEGIAFADAAR